MLATRWQPFNDMRSELNRLRREMENVFGQFGLSDGLTTSTGYPPLNVWEDAENLYLEAELPGMELSDLEIFVNGGNQLSIKGQRKAPELEKGSWHRRERGYGAFTRLLDLPCPINPDSVHAELKLGVLTITLPKSEAARPRRIEVKAE
jgi:HSP20 family protein